MFPDRCIASKQYKGAPTRKIALGLLLFCVVLPGCAHPSEISDQIDASEKAQAAIATYNEVVKKEILRLDDGRIDPAILARVVKNNTTRQRKEMHGVLRSEVFTDPVWMRWYLEGREQATEDSILSMILDLRLARRR